MKDEIGLSLPHIGIVLFFVSDCGWTAVAGEDVYRVGQNVEFVADAVKQVLVVAAGKIGTADTFIKQHIACDEQLVFGVVEHDVAGRVAGCVQHIKTVAADMKLCTFFKPLFGCESGTDGKAVGSSFFR